MSRVASLAAFLLTLTILCRTPPAGTGQEPAPATSWTADAEFAQTTSRTMDGLGAMQGVSFRDGKVYLYGDVWNANPRVGVIREYSSDYKPTGRVVWLHKGGKPLLRHPTGLTWHRQLGTFLGDTVQKRGVIYRFDWEKSWQDGNLDRALLDVIDDDAAVNGCRPEFVTLGGKDYLATSDYGDVHPEVRLYDPELLVRERRSSAPGVVVYRFLCGPFNQNLHWDAARGELTCVQNAVVGRGWRLDVLNLEKAVRDGRADGPGVRVRKQTFTPRDELEGYRPLADGSHLFVTSSRKGNLVVAKVKEKEPGTAPGNP
jgi:hypothetical protein